MEIDVGVGSRYAQHVLLLAASVGSLWLSVHMCERRYHLKNHELFFLGGQMEWRWF